jgi:hypothetical protein
MKYRDALLPLLSFDMQVQVKREGVQPVLVLSEQGHSVGLLIDEIVDISRWARTSTSSWKAVCCRSPDKQGSAA